MDETISAFAIYQKQNKKKRKSPQESRNGPALTEHPKKKKKGNLQANTPKSENFNKQVKLNVSIAPESSGLNLQKANVQTNRSKNQANAKTKEKKAEKMPKLNLLVSPESTGSSSEEDIPTLVPVVLHNGNESKNDIKQNGLQKVKSSSSSQSKPVPKVQTNKLKKPVKDTSQPIPSDPAIFNPVTQGLAIFKWLIDPITPKEFFEKYWEKDVLYVKRTDKTYFNDVFSSEKLDSILREFPLHFTRNVDVVAYQNGKKEVMEEEGRALPSKLWDFYNNGCSIRILNPQTYDQNVHSIISSLQEYFGSMVGTNAYLTPPDSQGFAPHFDDIEAFIVQLEGSKDWKLYKPKEEDVLARDSSHNFNPEDLGPPFMEVNLNAGDLLYFPRGTIHEGRTKAGEHSLHITVSVYQHTAYIDLLEHALPVALKKAAQTNVEFRRGLPLNYLKHLGIVNKNDPSNKRKIILNKIKSLVTSLVDYVDADLAADQLGRRFMHDAMPPLYSQEEAQHSSKFDGDCMKNGRVFNRVEITPEIKIRLLRYYALRVVQESESTSKIYFCIDNAKTYHGEEEQWLEIDNSLLPCIEMLQKQYPEFVVANDLPIKDEIEKLGLVSSLWEHGLLVTDEPLPSCDSDASSNSNSSVSVYELLESYSD